MKLSEAIKKYASEANRNMPIYDLACDFCSSYKTDAKTFGQVIEAMEKEMSAN